MSNTLTESTNISLNIKTVFVLLWKRVLPILLCAALCGLGTLLYYSIFVPAQYTATVSIIVDNRSIGDPDSASLSLKSTSDISASRLLTETYIAIFSTSSFLESVSNNVNDTSEIISDGGFEPMNSKTLRDRIKMSAVNNTEILEIKVSTSSPQLCVDVCYAIMEEAKIVLAETLDQSEVKSVEGDNILIPTDPSSPSPFFRMIVGIVVGGFIGCLAVIISFVVKSQLVLDGATETFPRKAKTPLAQKTRPAPVYSAPQASTPAQTPATNGYNEPVYSSSAQDHNTPEYTSQQEYSAPVYAQTDVSIPAQSTFDGDLSAPKMRTRPRPQRQAPTSPRK